MSLKQQAHALIDNLEDEEALQRVISYIILNRKADNTHHSSVSAPISESNEKWQAFMKLEAWKSRNPYPPDYDCDAARREAMEDKYGRFA